MNPYEIKGRSFLLWWIACAVFVYPLALSMIGILLIPIASLLSAINSTVLLTMLMFVLVLPLIGAVAGGCVGHLQRRLLRKRLYWAAEHWRRWSALGGALGAVAAAVVGILLDITMGAVVNTPDSLLWLVAMPVIAGCISSLQWLSLRHVADDSWLWVLANVVGGVVFVGFIVMNLPDATRSADDYLLNAFGLWLLAVITQGAITGYVMLFLFEKKLRPLEGNSAQTDEPQSIWDRAI